MKGTEELKVVKIGWKLKTCKSMAQYAEQWKCFRKSILNFAARTLWNMAEYV